MTVRYIIKHLRQWSNMWIKIAELLGVPSSVISTISVITTHQRSDETALYKVVEWWFKNTANPEWTAIHHVITQLDCNE